MLTLIAAAAAAAAQPAAPAQPMPMGQMPMMQMGQGGEHKDMDCCKHCSEHMAAKHEGENADHADHQKR